jgi:hypothetical protein
MGYNTTKTVVYCRGLVYRSGDLSVKLNRLDLTLWVNLKSIDHTIATVVD